MKILIATIFDYPHAGGLSTHVKMLKAGLEANGHQVDIASFSNVPRFIQLSIKGSAFILNKINQGLGMYWSHFLRRIVLAKQISQKVKQGNYDVINSQDVFSCLAAKDTGLKQPVVLTLHGYMTFEAISKGSIVKGSPAEKYFLDLEKKAYLIADQIVTVDSRIKNYVTEKVDRSGHIRMIHNFIDTDAFNVDKLKNTELRTMHNISPSAKVIFCPRRMTEKNGVIYPALAMPELIKRDENYLLVYAGDGEEKAKLEDIIKKNNLSKYVKLLGAIPHEKTIDFYTISDVVVIPSVHSAGVEEATSISAIEGMATGVPVVATNIGGLVELINDEENGLLVEQKDTHALAEAIHRVATDKVLAKNLGSNSRQSIVKKYSHLSAAQKYAGVYETALQGRLKGAL